MTDDSLLPFDLPAVRRKKVTAAFEGGLISSDGGLVLLRAEERRIGLAGILANCLRDRRDPALVTHDLAAARLRHIAGSHWSTRKYMNMVPLYAQQTSTTGAVA